MVAMVEIERDNTLPDMPAYVGTDMMSDRRQR
jgi:CYTH domain-containing protein